MRTHAKLKFTCATGWWSDYYVPAPGDDDDVTKVKVITLFKISYRMYFQFGVNYFHELNKYMKIFLIACG